jgi:glycosyltransferase involved in cell wall biosynthesis
MSIFLAGGSPDGRMMTTHRRTKTGALRILMVAPTSFFSDYGGHIRILEEVKALQLLGHEVAIVTYYKGSDLPGLDIRRTPKLPYRAEYEVGSSRHKIAFDVYLVGQVLREGFRFRPDVVHGHMHEGALIGGLLARLLRVPLLFDFQGSMTAEMVDHHFLRRDGRLFPLIYRLENWINRLPGAVLTSSSKALHLLREEFRIPSQKLFSLPDCADTVRFDRAQIDQTAREEIRRRFHLPTDRPIIAYLGLLTDYQGIPHLIGAAVRLQARGEPVHFLIMGYPNVKLYQQVAVENGVAGMMTFTGKVEYRYAPAYLSLGDIGVAPKMSRTEGSGKLLNYMALEQPVVAYDSAVHREYLGEDGVYAPLGDIDGFVEGLCYLLHNPDERAARGRRLRRRAEEKFSWQRAGEQIVAVYEKLLTKTG